ncbi:MAG: hypothetical protein KC636_39845, partial [Myxococcales bacterium]|nr:hypothetical protein [Myxococcales bacterium]
MRETPEQRAGVDGEPVDVRSLLTIDVDAELRKLTSAGLEGPWQLPSELVRRAVHAGARAVAVVTGWRRVEVVDDGDPIPGEQLTWLMTLLDDAAPSERRHQALLALEGAAAHELLALTGLLRGHEFELTSGGARIVAASGRPPRREAAATRGGTTIAVRGPGLDVARARRWVKEMCRFAPGRVTLDGAPVNDGAGDFMCSTALRFDDGAGEARVTGLVALTARGEQTRVWLLQHGVVTTHVGINNAPCFEAVVDFGPSIPGRASAIDLRTALARELSALVDRAVSLMLQVARRIAGLTPRTQERLLRLLFLCARRGYRVDEIRQLAILPRAVDGAELGWMSVEAIERAVQVDASGHRHVQALYPEQSPAGFALRGPPVLILDAPSRSALSELFKLRFHPPAPRSDGQTLRERAREGLMRIGWALGDRLRPGARQIPAHELDADDRRFLELLRVAVSGPADAPEEVHLCHGHGVVRRTRGPPSKLLLPRQNPDVAACR